MKPNYVINAAVGWSTITHIVVDNFHETNKVCNYPINENFLNLSEILTKHTVAIFKIKWK